MVENPPAAVGDTGMIPGLRRFHRLWNDACVLRLPSPHSGAQEPKWAAEAQMVQLLTMDIYRDQWNLIENQK